MPVIPPDPGKVARVIEGLRAQLRELEELLSQGHHPVLVLAIENVRIAVDLLEKKLRAAKD